MDITKCVHETCPIKESCYRHTAPISDYQSMSNFEPEELTSLLGKTYWVCESFWDKKEFLTSEEENKDGNDR